MVRVLAEAFLPQCIEERAAAAARTRSVTVTDLPDGLAALVLTAPAVLVHGIYDRATQQARSVVDARADADDDADERDTQDGAAGAPSPDVRTMDEVRADVVTDLLLTGTPDRCVAGEGVDAIRATVQVTVPVLTMTGASAEPCLLAGYARSTPRSRAPSPAMPPVGSA